MNIEDIIFRKTHIDFKKLEDYGFKKFDKIYKYSKVFMDNFKAEIIIDENKVSGKIYDLSIEEEYINFRIENGVGEFVSKVREEYKNILKDIVENCTEKFYFITKQANRITKLIINMYNDKPEFAWEKFPGYGIFRNPNNEKWYSLIMNIDKSKIDKKCTGEVEIINVKVDEELIPSLLKRKGFYPSYHMNKKNWITIVLDNTLSDDEIMKYVSMSHKFTESPNEWIIPANPKFYDVINCFNDTDTIIWKPSNNIKVGDMVYLYVASPYSAILYKCEVVDSDIPYQYKDKNVSMNRVMKIKLLKKFNEDKYTFTKLNEYGIKAVRGPRSMPEKLSKEINK